MCSLRTPGFRHLTILARPSFDATRGLGHHTNATLHHHLGGDLVESLVFKEYRQYPECVSVLFDLVVEVVSGREQDLYVGDRSHPPLLYPLA